jgi:CHASE2 domain-containing sensor protein
MTIARTGRLTILWKRLRKALPTILLAIVGTYILSRLGTLHGLERLVVDAEMAASPQQSADIRVVNITNEDYNNQFGGKPVSVHPLKLHDLIDAIAVSSPAVIAVDIDTSDPDFKRFHPDPKWPKVIWERDLASNDLAREAEIEPLDVLGGQNPKFNLNSGIPQLYDDPEDKTTRLYQRCIETKAGPIPSFVYAVVAAYRGGNSECENEPDAMQPFFIRYSLRPETSLYQRSAAQVLGLSGRKAAGGQETPIAEFKGKIVLLGGTYRDFDRHPTPIGTLPGIVVLANAIESELTDKPVKALSRTWLFALELLSSSLLVVLFTLFPLTPVRLFAFGLLVSAVISLGLSYLSFHTLSRFANFAPTLLAVLVFEIYEHVRHESIVESIEAEHKTEAAGHKQP